MAVNEAMIIRMIERRRRQILVHSFGYYRLNDNIIDDTTYDKWSKELAIAQTKFPELSKKAKLYEEFKEFDGSTGYNLPLGTPWIAAKWEQLKYCHKLHKKGELIV